MSFTAADRIKEIAIIIITIIVIIAVWRFRSRRKPLSDTGCRQNYTRLRALFDTVVEDHDQFGMVYAYVEDTSGTGGILSSTPFVYMSYAVGFNAIANELVLLRIKVDWSGHGDPLCLTNVGVESAWLKQASDLIKIGIQDARLPKQFIELHIPWQISQDSDGEVLQIKQNDEANQFLEFFNKQFSK